MWGPHVFPLDLGFSSAERGFPTGLKHLCKLGWRPINAIGVHCVLKASVLDTAKKTTPPWLLLHENL